MSSAHPTPRISDAGRNRGQAQLHHAGDSFEDLDSADWAQSPWHVPSIEKANAVYLSQLFREGKRYIDAPQLYNAFRTAQRP